MCLEALQTPSSAASRDWLADLRRWSKEDEALPLEEMAAAAGMPMGMALKRCLEEVGFYGLLRRAEKKSKLTMLIGEED